MSPASGHPFSVRLFGPFTLQIDGTPLARFATVQGRALLAYLLLRPDQFHAREKLADLFWPEHVPSKARQNLRQTLSRLRRDLSHNPDGFLVDRNTVRLSAELYDVDALRFQALIATCAAHSHRAVERCIACCTRLEEAVDLYRGELLAGLNIDASPDFEEWLLQRREYFHLQAVDALRTLLLHHQTLQDHASVRRFARRLIELDPYQESAHASLIEALAQMGETRAALDHYDRCVALLADELGVAPGDALVNLGQKLRLASPQENVGAPLVPSLSPAPRFHHFPATLTPFFGRQAEVAHIIERLADPNCRLLTVTGPGGIGKSRLIVEAARQISPLDFPDGLYFIPLAPLTESTSVAQAIAASLEIPLVEGIPARRQLLRELADKDLLLILDNFEHLMESIPLLLEILARAPGVSCLVSSRLALQVQAEWLLPLGGLTFPDVVEDSSQPQPHFFPYPTASQPATLATTPPFEDHSAVALFLDRARRVRPGFALDDANRTAILSICRLAQGMPLAISMAASGLAVHDAADIATRMARSLDLLRAPMRDLPPRHQSMRAAFAVSWDLLDSPAQRTLARLSVFHGGFDLAAAQAVTGASPLDMARLVTASLITHQADGRYSLHELLRQFAAERLAQIGLDNPARQAHSRYFLALLAEESTHLHAHGQPQAIRRLAPDLANLHAAWAAAAQDRDWPLVAESLQPYFQFLHVLGLGVQGLAQLEAASAVLEEYVGQAPAAMGPGAPLDLGQLWELLARLKLAEGRLLQNAAPFGRIEGLLQEALQFAGQMADAPQDLLGEIHLALTKLYNQQGQRRQAEEQMHQARRLLRDTDDHALQARLHLELATQIGEHGDTPQRRFYFEEAVRLAEASGDLVVEAITRRYLIHVQFRGGDFSQADHHLHRLLDNARLLQNPLAEAIALTHFAGYRFFMGDFPGMAAYDAQSLPLIWRVGAPLPMGRTFMRQGLAALYTGDLAAGIEIAEQALAHARDYRSLDVEGAVSTLLGRLRLAQQDLDGAWQAFARGAEIVHQEGRATDTISARLGQAAVRLAQGEPVKARSMIEPLLPEVFHTLLGFVPDRGFVYLQLFRILAANQDLRAEQLLRRALSHLTRIAATIADEHDHHSFWECVPDYRELRRLAEAAGVIPP